MVPVRYCQQGADRGWEYMVNTLVNSFPSGPVQEEVVGWNVSIQKKEIEVAGRLGY